MNLNDIQRALAGEGLDGWLFFDPEYSRRTEERVLAIGLAAYIDQFRTDYSNLFAMATRLSLSI